MSNRIFDRRIPVLLTLSSAMLWLFASSVFICVAVVDVTAVGVTAQDATSGQRDASDQDRLNDHSTRSHRPSVLSTEKVVRRVIFGSCIKQDQPMPIFEEMLKQDSDLALLIGDNIYGDTDDMAVLREKYQTLRRNPHYSAFERSVPILATWDDHDYGLNDGGADFVKRSESQAEFLHFWNVPKNSGRWDREGVYHCEILGPPGSRLQVILLDTRFFRSPLKQGPTRRVAGPYVADPDPSKTMLGDDQWKWLAEWLLEPAEVRLVVSSIQCLPEAAGQETWSNLPAERKKLLDLLRSTSANGVILLSGDRHWAELSVLRNELDYPLYELTSSSLNQKHPRGTPSENRFRAVPQTFHQENFGLIDVDWSQTRPEVELQLLDAEGQTRISQRVVF
ncbi:MAG: alkaline phosphatase D family protein [Rubripirellula sp.]